MNPFEDILIEAAERRLLNAANKALDVPLSSVDPELGPMEEEEIQPGVLLVGLYYLPLLVLERSGDRVRVAPTSPLSSATLPSEARLPWGEGALVFCGWGERTCALADLHPAIWCGSLNTETLGKVRHILEEGRKKETCLLPALQGAAKRYKVAAGYPWRSCFPAFEGSVTCLPEATEGPSSLPVRQEAMEKVHAAVRKAQASAFTPFHLPEEWQAMAAADAARPFLDETYTKDLGDGTLSIHMEEDRVRGKVILTMRLEGEKRKNPLCVIIRTSSGTYERKLNPNRSQFQELSIEEIGGETFGFKVTP